MWCITERGEKFVKGQLKVNKSVYVFNNKFLGFDGELISIRQSLGNKFDYSELMKETTMS